ncbi:3-phosphoshikimate 1-carboxyvinyltransferase [Bosea lathyri]|uniref:3-phosphoshikimate 1-carboxyvinyltransferase n=1 Tax=Bosea lathyri TaxID=1036778 RepID=A0A1H6CF31_9HYPH|nr:3-phosphoshikimate 1-carboxyvinyltransferase [Bosea lathyri]SEG71629.1 3-phosphoshikimate 1-carboxyvinyltransferase [Bosea lathyri]
MNDRDRQAITVIPPTHPLRGRVAPPGSKSITNRVLLLAALAKGTSHLTGALKSDDTRYMAEALRAMGVTIAEPDETSFIVTGDGRLRAPAAPLFLGNAGTATRFLTAAAALVDGQVVIDGDAHMRKRPIGPLLTALRSLGIDASSETGCPPVTIRGTGGFAAGRVEIDGGLSSQYVSALLMMAACGSGPVDIVLAGDDIGARGYIELTLAAMAAFGARVEQSASSWRVAPTGYRAVDFAIEPDASAATYLWAAEVLTGGAIDLGVPATAFTQPDARAYELIASFPHLPAVIDGSQMQDAVPTLAVLAAFNETPVRFTGIANLRVKECDRVAALAVGLSEISPGLGREEGDDLLVASDPSLAGRTLPASIDTRADHRMAMSFALAGLKVHGITILESDCVAKTYPGYWWALGSLGVALEGDVPEQA